MTNAFFVNNGEFQGQVDGSYVVTPFFEAQELACPKTKIVQYEPIFLCALSALRFEVDHGMTINSGCRTPEYNKTVEGAHPRSLHQTINPHHKNAKTHHSLAACAVDVSTLGWSDAKIKNFVAKAEARGFSVGIAKTFIHLDMRSIAGLKQHRFYYGSAKEWFVSI